MSNEWEIFIFYHEQCRIKIAGWYKNEENFIFWKYYDVSKWRGIRGKKCSIKRFRESSRMLSLAVSTILINQTNWQLPIIRLRVFHDLSNFIILNSFANFHFFTLFKKFFIDYGSLKRSLYRSLKRFLVDNYDRDAAAQKSILSFYWMIIFQ